MECPQLDEGQQAEIEKDGEEKWRCWMGFMDIDLDKREGLEKVDIVCKILNFPPEYTEEKIERLRTWVIDAQISEINNVSDEARYWLWQQSEDASSQDRSTKPARREVVAHKNSPSLGGKFGEPMPRDFIEDDIWQQIAPKESEFFSKECDRQVRMRLIQLFGPLRGVPTEPPVMSHAGLTALSRSRAKVEKYLHTLQKLALESEFPLYQLTRKWLHNEPFDPEWGWLQIMGAHMKLHFNLLATINNYRRENLLGDVAKNLETSTNQLLSQAEIDQLKDVKKTQDSIKALERINNNNQSNYPRQQNPSNRGGRGGFGRGGFRGGRKFQWSSKKEYNKPYDKNNRNAGGEKKE